MPFWIDVGSPPFTFPTTIASAQVPLYPKMQYLSSTWSLWAPLLPLITLACLPCSSLSTSLIMAYLSPTPKGNFLVPDFNYAYGDQHQPIKPGYCHFHSHSLPLPLCPVLLSHIFAETIFLPSHMLSHNIPSQARFSLPVPASGSIPTTFPTNIHWSP